MASVFFVEVIVVFFDLDAVLLCKLSVIKLNFTNLFCPQVPKRNFLRRTTTKATAAPETTTASSDNTETTTNTSSPPVNRFNRRGNSKFKPRKELEKSVEKNEIETVSRRPSLNGVAQRNGPPANRKFISRRRLGGANATTVVTTTPVPTASTTRRPNRLLNRRRPSSTTTTTAPTTSTEATTTKLYEDEDSLQEIGDTDAIEDPTLEPRKPKISTKVQRRPLILKDSAADQNPSATNEDENKRQSKKYSASIKQNQLDDLVKRVSEESSTERRTTTVEDISPETAVALAAHQLITAPVPIVTDFEDDDIKPTRKIQTTVEYKYTSREYNEYTNDDSRTPSYEYQSTPIYKSNTLGSDDIYKTQTDFDSTKASDFDAHRTTLQKYPTTPEYKTIDYVQTTKSDSYTDFGSPKISTYDVKSTHYPSTAIDQDYTRTTITEYTEPEFDAPKSTSTPFVPKTLSTNIPTNTVTGKIFGESTTDLYTRLTDFLPKSGYRNTITQDYTRTSAFPETSTGFVSKNSPSYVPNFSSSTYPNTAIEENEPQSRISTTLSPLPSSRTPFGRTTATLAENSARIVSGFTPRATEATKLRKGFSSDLSANVVTSGYSGVQRGSSKFREEKLIPVPVEDGGYSTVGYSGPSQEPSYFTREYLLESPVTKTYDEEFQYLSPITTPQVPTPTVTRRVIRKKIQRKISTTQRPTTTTTTTTTPSPPQSTTTVVPRRVPAKAFDKVPKEKKKYRPIANYDYYDDGVGTLGVKYEEGTKVVMHENGNIECLDIGNFPHPTSCKKFISCARIDNGSLLGWEYVCPKGLSFDPVGGICNWSAGLGCKE